MLGWKQGPGRASVAVGLVLGAALAGRGSLKAVTVEPAHAAPAVRFQQAAGPTAVIADPGDIPVGVATTLDSAGSTGDALTFSWDFGDGSTAAGLRAQHTYAKVDDYILSLTVRDRSGATNTTTRTVRVVPDVTSITGRPVLGQIVPASSFTSYVTANAVGPSGLSLKVGGPYTSSDSWQYAGVTGPLQFEVPGVDVATENNPDIDSQIISTPGGSIPLQNNVNVTFSYAVSSGRNESVTYTLSLLRPTGDAAPASSTSSNGAQGGGSGAAYEQTQPSPTPTPRSNNPGPQAPTRNAPTPTPTPAPQPPPQQPAFWSITYPNYLTIVGRPVNEDDINDYYLKGDPQFHHVNDPLVRRFALRIARAGGIFPDDPKVASGNIYRYVHGLLGIGDPGELQTDQIIIDRIINGTLVPGARNGEYICIAHAYFLSSLTRTLGLPTREETIGFGRGVSQDNSGAWIMNYYQEGANEVWYDGDWHHYDTWIGTTDRADYLSTNLTEIAWYAFGEAATPFTDVHDQPVGLAGHDFSLGKLSGTPGSPDQWRFLEQQTRPGIRVAPPGPDAFQSTDRAPGAPREELVVAGISNPAPASPDAP